MVLPDSRGARLKHAKSRLKRAPELRYLRLLLAISCIYRKLKHICNKCICISHVWFTFIYIFLLKIHCNVFVWVLYRSFPMLLRLAPGGAKQTQAPGAKSWHGWWIRWEPLGTSSWAVHSKIATPWECEPLWKPWRLIWTFGRIWVNRSDI